MNGKKTTIKSKIEAAATKKPKHLMGFREWCETVWEPVEARKRKAKIAIENNPPSP